MSLHILMREGGSLMYLSASYEVYLFLTSY
jgi:hypothetical protein